MHLFVAVWPDAETRRRIAALELTRARGVKAVEPAQWHVTLRFLGDVDDQLVPGLIDALGSVAGSVSGGIRCELGPSTAWFPGERVLQVPVSGLDTLAGAVQTATRPIVPDAGRGERPFTGHLTIARSNGRPADAPTRAGLDGLPVSSSFAVDSIDLVRTRGSSPGPRYTTLARVPLAG